MKIYSVPGNGPGTIVLTDATSLRMFQHLMAYLPGLLEAFSEVIVVVAEAAETAFQKAAESVKAAEIIEQIKWTGVEAVVHTADPSFLTIQLRIEEEAAEHGIPVIRLEDIPGACFRTDITDSTKQLKATAITYGVVNETGRQIARENGVSSCDIEIIGVPDWQYPDPAKMEVLRQLRGSWKKGLGYRADDQITFFSSTSQFQVDQPALMAVLEAHQTIGGVLLIGLHPKLDPARYVGQNTPQAQLMLERSTAYLDFLQQQGFLELGANPGASLVYSLKGIGGLMALGCGNLAADLPNDVLPCDLFLGTFDNNVFFNNAWGITALNLCPPEVQAAHQASVGTPFPMAVTSGALPELVTHEEMVKAIIAAHNNPADFLISSRKLLETVPYAGATSVRRIVGLVK